MQNEAERRGAVGGTPGTKCDHCKLEYGPEGHDACLGELIGLMNACCGHENKDMAYVQFLDGECIRGEDAIIIIEVLKRHRLEYVRYNVRYNLDDCDEFDSSHKTEESASKRRDELEEKWRGDGGFDYAYIEIIKTKKENI